MKKILTSLMVVSLMVGVGYVYLQVAPTKAEAHEVVGDFITAGGFILSDLPAPPAPARANFGAAGGCKNGGWWGHLNHVDHGFPSNLHIKHEEITCYVRLNDFPPDPRNGQPRGIRRVRGTATVNQMVTSTTTCAPGLPATYQLNLTDDGEPGHDRDVYELMVCGGTGPCEFANHCYYAFGKLGEGQQAGGGNVQLHKGNSSNSCPAVVPADCF